MTLYRLPQVLERIPLSRSRIYEMMSRGEFPLPIKIGARAVAWRAIDIETWVESRSAKRKI